MPFYYTHWVILPLLSACVNGALAFHAWQRRHIPAALWVGWLMAGLAGWSLSYALNTAADELWLKNLFFKSGTTFFCVTLIVVLPMLFSVTGHSGKAVSRRMLALLSVVPVITTILTWSNDIHGLMRGGLHLITNDGLLLLGYTDGPYFGFHIVYSYLVFLLVIVLCLKGFFTCDRKRRSSLGLIAVATLIPLVTDMFKLSPVTGLSLATSTLFLSGLCYWWATFRHHLLVLSDVAELHRAHEELRESDERFRILAENSADTIWQLDPELRLVYISRADQAMRGFIRDELIGKSILELMSSEGAAEAAGLHAERRKKEQQGIRTGALRFDVQLKCKDGGLIWTEINSNPLRNDDGLIIGYIGAIRDISERKRIENELIAEKHKLLKTLRISDNYQTQLMEVNSRIKGMVEEEERSRLYRDLHDGAGQSLQAVCLHLKMLADGKGGFDDPKPLAAQLAREVADIAAELRDIAHQLRPSYLAEITLDKAITRRCEILVRRGVAIDVACSGDFASLPHETSDNLYRIAQEALANAARHAGAQLITVRLTQADHMVRLMIADDGCGMKEMPPKNDGMGLRIMQERATLIGASFDVTTSRSGTIILVTLERP